MYRYVGHIVLLEIDLPKWRQGLPPWDGADGKSAGSCVFCNLNTANVAFSKWREGFDGRALNYIQPDFCQVNQYPIS